MGLNIGVHVKRQEEGYMSYGHNPKGTREEVQASFNTFLRKKYPEDRFTPTVETDTMSTGEERFIFDVRMNYDWNHYDSTPMYLAILEFVLTHFSTDYGIDVYVYHSP